MKFKPEHLRVAAYLVFLVTVPLGEVAIVGACPWLTATKAGFLCLVAALAVSLLRGWRPSVPPPALLVSLAGLSLAVCLAAAWSRDPIRSALYAARLVGLCLLCLITAAMAAEPGFHRRVLAGLVGIVFVLSLLGMYQTLTGSTIAGLGQYGYFGRPIEIAYGEGSAEASVVRASATFDHPNVFWL